MSACQHNFFDTTGQILENTRRWNGAALEHCTAISHTVERPLKVCFHWPNLATADLSSMVVPRFALAASALLAAASLSARPPFRPSPLAPLPLRRPNRAPAMPPPLPPSLPLFNNAANLLVSSNVVMIVFRSRRSSGLLHTSLPRNVQDNC